jgi:hypothetical protein
MLSDPAIIAPAVPRFYGANESTGTQQGNNPDNGDEEQNVYCLISAAACHRQAL